jgi:PAS domain-containing protein
LTTESATRRRNFLYANQAVPEYTGLAKEKVRSETFRDVFHPEDFERLRDERAAAIFGDSSDSSRGTALFIAVVPGKNERSRSRIFTSSASDTAAAEVNEG